MELSEPQAREIFFGIHDAWNDRDIERLLSFYTDDVIYWTNAGPNGQPLELEGKARLRDFLAICVERDATTAPDDFVLVDGIGRGRVTYIITDDGSGQTHTASYRQVFKFRGLQVCRLEDYCDAGPLTAFYEMMRPPQAPIDARRPASKPEEQD